MTFDAWITIGVLVVVFALLAKTRIGPDLILMAGLTALLLTGVLDPAEAFSGFSNEGIIIIGILFVVATGLQESGGIWLVVSRILGRTRSVVAAQARIMLPVAVLSGFLNNTPIVAMLLPAVSDWAKKNQLPLSKLLIPLSYASILGGMCTLVGTSTNLIVNGLLIKEGLGRLSMFEITQIGLPCAVVGIGFILLIGRKYLPDRQSLAHTLEDPREYVLEMVVERDSSLVGQTIEEADLRHLPGLYLMEIDRDGQALAAVSPDERLQAGDRLVFVGIVESIVDLQRVRGLRPATEQVFKLDSPRRERCLIEAVVSNSCPLVNKTIREGRFRTAYKAAIIAVSRNGVRIKKKIGDIILRPGDTLLLESHPSFLEQQRNSRDFFLISRIEGYTPPRHDKAPVALGILAAMVAVVTLGWLSLLKASMIAAGLMILTHCCRAETARQNVSWRLLIIIAAAFGIGRAMEVTGAANSIAEACVGLAFGSPWVALAVIYAITVLFTAIITSHATAALIFPIAIQTAHNLGVSHEPFVFVLIVAAAASFITPFAYPTNLMVFGPGGYKFSDFVRIGLPLNLLVGITAVLLIPFIWPFG